LAQSDQNLPSELFYCTVTFKKFVVLGIQNPQVAFPKSKQFMGWPKYDGNTSITQDNSQSILSVLPSSYQFLQIDVKKSKHDLSRLQITAIFTRNTLVDICAMICIPNVL